MHKAPSIDVQLVRSGEAPGGDGEPGTAVTAAAVANQEITATKLDSACHWRA